MSSRTFRKAVWLLSDPISLAAIALLFINDHILRWMVPSWLTGKLGDFAWLFFIPFALAALMSWLIPPRLPRHEQTVFYLSFGLVAGIFTLGNTLPAFHTLLVHLLETLLGIPVGLRRDPTDLIALVSIGASWWLWVHRADGQPSFVLPGWVTLPLAVVLTIANSPAPDPGIGCLDRQDDQLLASSAYADFASTDGGLTWQAVDHGSRCHSPGSREKTVTDPLNPDTLYRYTPGEVIERSDDGGETWQSEFSVPPLSRAEGRYYSDQPGAPTLYPVPLDAEADPPTGNIIFAMGHRGVLVREANGEWLWVPVGGYQQVTDATIDAFYRARAFSPPDTALLPIGAGILAVVFGLLSVNTLGLRLHARWLWWLLTAIVVVGWLWWVAGVLLGTSVMADLSSYSYEYLYLWGTMIAPLALISFALATVTILLAIRKAPKKVLSSAIVTLIGMSLFSLPYLLWALQWLKNYHTVILLAPTLSIVALLGGLWWMWKSPRSP